VSNLAVRATRQLDTNRERSLKFNILERAAGSRWGLGSGLWALERERIGHEETSRNLMSSLPIHLRYATHTKLKATGDRLGVCGLNDHITLQTFA
jgi:hypothetical protein